MATTVSVSEDTADRLHDRKARGESYDDVIRRLLDRGLFGGDPDMAGDTTLNSQGKLSLKPSNGGRTIRYAVEFRD